MKAKRKSLAAALLLMAASTRLFAADVQPLTNDQLVAQAKGLVRANTAVLMHADLALVDAKQLSDRLQAKISKMQLPPEDEADFKKQSAAALEQMGKWIAAFRTAGGRQIYMTAIDERNNGGEIIIAPLEEGADGKAISGLLYSGKADGPTADNENTFGNNKSMLRYLRSAQVVDLPSGKAVVMANRQAMELLTKQPAAERAELQPALESTGGSIAQLLVMPSSTSRATIERQLGNNLPPPLGGGPTSALTRDIQWISVAYRSDQDQTAKAIVQCKDENAAKAAMDIYQNATKMLLMMSAAPGQPNWAKLVGAAQPVVEGDKLTLALDDAALDKIAPAVGFVYLEQQKTVKRMMAMSNIRQLIQGCVMYANDHQGVWPDKLDDVTEKYLGGNKAVLKNPAHPEMDTPFVYLKPGDVKKNPQNRVVIYESVDAKSPYVSTGFADGHVETLSRSQFEAKLKEAEAKEDGGL